MDENKKFRIADYLKKGKDNAMTTQELLELTGLQTPRALQNAIAKERKEIVIWLDSKQSNRKTKRGIKAFITNWLSKSQDKARSYAPVRGNTYQTRNQRVDSDLVDWCRAVEGR